ncbi:MAG: hypothetical protein WBG50_04750 [Desulfomonilaceae bacterium]
MPFTLNADSEVFGEAHTEFQDFWNTLRSAFTNGTTNSSFNNRVDMSFGGGFRTFLRRDTLLGVNGFYDTSRLGSTWYSSGGVGLEMAALLGSDALDFNFNWYGQLFNSNVIRNAFRYGPSNFDFQAGYSHELWNGGPDLRLSATGYKFDIGNSVYGWNGGAELWSRDAMFVLRYNIGHDKVNETYQEVGGFVNIGFQLENIFKGESPFTKPEPIFKSPRTLRYLLTQPVRRDWHQAAAVVLTRQGQGQAAGGPTPLFTRTAFVGAAHNGAANPRLLNAEITAADLVGVNRVVITWDGGAAPTGSVIVRLQNSTACTAAGFVQLNGATSPPGVQTTDPNFWSFVCGPPWNTLNVGNTSGADLIFGTMTLSFFP